MDRIELRLLSGTYLREREICKSGTSETVKHETISSDKSISKCFSCTVIEGEGGEVCKTPMMTPESV